MQTRPSRVLGIVITGEASSSAMLAYSSMAILALGSMNALRTPISLLRDDEIAE